jgi:hypothetical protein
MEFIIAVIVSRLASVAFVVCGIYSLQNGFIKTGGWLIAGGILSVLCTSITSRKNKKEGDAE